MEQRNIIKSTTQSNPQTAAVATSAFHHPNGFPPPATRGPSADIEMVSFNCTSYTSLRDLLPPITSPAPFTFPRPPSYNSACEIPIKNPLVKHAAIAYLQPMSSAPAVEEEGKGILGAIVDRCKYGCCGIEDEDEGLCCLLWFGHVVSRTARWAGLGRDGPNNNNPEDEDEDEEEDEEDCEVVDQPSVQCFDR